MTIIGATRLFPTMPLDNIAHVESLIALFIYEWPCPVYRLLDDHLTDKGNNVKPR